MLGIALRSRSWRHNGIFVVVPQGGSGVCFLCCPASGAGPLGIASGCAGGRDRLFLHAVSKRVRIAVLIAVAAGTFMLRIAFGRAGWRYDRALIAVNMGRLRRLRRVRRLWLRWFRLRGLRRIGWFWLSGFWFRWFRRVSMVWLCRRRL